MWSRVFRALLFTLNNIGIVTNLTALIHIAKSFNLKIPIFSLIFTDAFIATACSLVYTFLAIIRVAAPIDSPGIVFCATEYMAILLPFYLGPCLTFLVTSVRCHLTLKAAKSHQQIENSKLFVATFSVFGLVTGLILSYVIANAALDLPFSFIVEECSRSAEEIRSTSKIHVLVMQVPNLFNVCSVIIDLYLIKFIRKKILPIDQPTEAITSISGQLQEGAQTPNSGAPESLSAQDSIPIHATIVSAIIVVPYFIIFRTFQAVSLEPEVRASIVRFVHIIIVIFRCPLATFLTFKSRKELLAERAKMRERQERQQIEIRNAMIKRETRRTRMSNEETTAV